MRTLRNLLLPVLFAITSSSSVRAQDAPEVYINNISQTVVKMSLVPGLSPTDSALAMAAKAAELNLRLVGQHKVHQTIRERGGRSPHLEILQFCDPDDAVRMVELDPLYAAYMPCRIALVEDRNGRPWLFMLNLDMLIDSNSLPPDLQAIAIRVNQAMLAVMTAGATGEF